MYYHDNPDIPRKGNKPNLNFYGTDSGKFIETREYILGPKNFNWRMETGLSSQNNWNIYHVEGATEYHQGFRQALLQMLDLYPELANYLIQFDGPVRFIKDYLEISWPNAIQDVTFLHGTSSTLLSNILSKGLCPRSITGMQPVYGARSSAKLGRADAIYLTTQETMAAFAARDAVKSFGGAKALLAVENVDPKNAIPDVDSGETTATMSLWRLGSIGYLGCISVDQLRVI